LFADAAFADIHVWAARSNRLVETLHGPSSGLTAIAFSSQGLLAGAGRDGTVRIWAPDPDLPLRTVHSPGVALSQAGSTEHAHLAAVGSAADGVVVTNEQGGEVATLALNSAVFGGDSQFVVTSDGGLAFAQHGRLDLVKLPSGDLLRSWPLVPSTASFGITAGGGDIADVTSNGALTLLSGGRPRTTQVAVDQSFGNAPDVLLSPDQRWVAVTGAIHPAGIRILNVPSLANVRTERGSEPAFSPSGRLLAILRPDLSIAILRTSDWHLQATLLGGLSMSRGGLSFSPDERLVAQTGDGKLRTWDASDGTVLTTRYVVDDIGDSASTLSLSPPVLTDAGSAIVGASRADAVETFEVCPSCLSATALLRQARLRLLEIREARSG
jgi:WD40 repeat protein